jgi:hypothetical protein
MEAFGSYAERIEYIYDMLHKMAIASHEQKIDFDAFLTALELSFTVLAQHNPEKKLEK